MTQQEPGISFKEHIIEFSALPLHSFTKKDGGPLFFALFGLMKAGTSLGKTLREKFFRCGINLKLLEARKSQQKR